MKNMDGIILTGIIFSCISCLCSCILLLFFSFYDIILIIFLSLLFLFFFVFLFLFVSEPSNKNNISIQVNAKDKKHFLVHHFNYQYLLEKNSILSDKKLPKYDLNNNKVPFITRVRLNNYLRNHYDEFSILESEKLISIDRVKEYFQDLKICDENEKGSFLKKRHFNTGYIIIIAIFIFILFYIRDFVDFVKHNGFPLICMSIFLFLLLLITINIILNKKRFQNESAGNLYSCIAYVHDKKVIGGEYDTYSIRIWDGKCYIIDKWFSVNKDFYDNGETVELFLFDNNDNSEIFIKFE